MKLKLFVWTDFCIDWTSGLAFAIAANEAEAREQIAKGLGFTPRGADWGTLEIKQLNKKTAFAVTGGG